MFFWPYLDLVPYQWFWYPMFGFWSMYGGWIIPDEHASNITVGACFNFNHLRVQPVHRLSFQPRFISIDASGQHPLRSSFSSPNVISRSNEGRVWLPDWPHPIVVFLHLLVLQVLLPFDECYYMNNMNGLLPFRFMFVGLLYAFLTTLLYLPWSRITLEGSTAERGLENFRLEF